MLPVRTFLRNPALVLLPRNATLLGKQAEPALTLEHVGRVVLRVRAFREVGGRSVAGFAEHVAPEAWIGLDDAEIVLVIPAINAALVAIDAIRAFQLNA